MKRRPLQVERIPERPCNGIDPCGFCIGKLVRAITPPTPMGDIPISFCEARRISADGP